MPNDKNSGKQAQAQKDETQQGYIRLKVVGQSGNEVQFRVKRTTLMEKLKRTYAVRLGVDVNTLRFLVDGNRVDDEMSAKSMGLEDGEIIEVFQPQHGGSLFCPCQPGN